MAKRWAVGVIWVVLLSVGVLPFSRSTAAEKAQTQSKVLITDVIIQGNRRMTTEQIRRYLKTHPGSEYIPSVVDEDVRGLYKLNQFSRIQTSLQPDGPGKAKISFHFREIPNKVQKVTFLGAKHIKEEELCNVTGVRPGVNLFPNLNRLGCRKIVERYADLGRLFTQCKLVKGGELDDTEVVYQIIEGPKVKVRDIQFTGNTFVSSAHLAQILASSSWFERNRVGGTYHAGSTEYESYEVGDYYRSHGYRDVKVAAETQRSADEGELTLIFHIEEGPRSVPEQDSRKRP